MRSEFQDVFKDAYDHWIDDASSHRYHASKGLALQVWNHQQSKVDELERIIELRDQQLTEEIALSTKYVGKFDELQNNINLLNEALDIKEQLNQKLREREDELQKRVDASLIAFENLKEEINELHGQCDLHLIKYLEEKSQVLEQALKGGFDASN